MAFGDALILEVASGVIDNAGERSVNTSRGLMLMLTLQMRFGRKLLS